MGQLSTIDFWGPSFVLLYTSCNPHAYCNLYMTILSKSWLETQEKDTWSIICNVIVSFGLFSPPLSGIHEVKKFYWISIWNPENEHAQGSRVIIVVVQVGQWKKLNVKSAKWNAGSQHKSTVAIFSSSLPICPIHIFQMTPRHVLHS